MEMSSATWISELEMENTGFMDQFEINPVEYPVGGLSFQNFSGESYSNYASIEQTTAVPAVGERPAKQPRVADSWNNYSYTADTHQKRAAASMNGTSSQAQDHVIAERKRREKLRLRLIALSALIPGLKKIDKASIIGDAIRYIKELQERVKVAEEQAAKMSVESAVFVRKPNISSCDENRSLMGSKLPEIEARISHKDVLLRIHCEKRQGFLPYLLNQIENFNLTILNSSVLPFGHSKLDITIVSRVDVGYCMTVEDLVKNLRNALFESSEIQNN